MIDHPEVTAALDLLDAALAIRLEQRKGPAVDQIGKARRHDAVTVVPIRGRYLQGGPLSELADILPIDDLELFLLVAAIAPSIDERYLSAYQHLSARTSPSILTGEMLRNLAGDSAPARAAAARALSPAGLLRQVPLLNLADDRGNPLAGEVTVPANVLEGLLDLPAPAPELSPDFPAGRLRTVHTVDDLVVNGVTRERIDDVVNRIANRPTVLGTWGLGQHHDSVAGVTVLLHGPPGTGKTMTAAVLAAEAGLHGLKVDLSTVVSKYIGETAKNLETVFRYAEQHPCLLFFDEADSIFGKRSEVSDARDRYANQEVSYLLQRIEDFPGVVVLASNLLSNIDSAFLRRINIVIEMNPPDKRQRRTLWRNVYPSTVPVDAPAFGELADRYQLTGAQIKEAAMEAAYQAASNGGTVTTDHLDRAIRLQFAKSGLMAPG